MKIHHYHVFADNTVELISDENLQGFIEYTDDPLYYRYMEILEDMQIPEVHVYFLGWGTANERLWHRFNDDYAKRLFVDNTGKISVYFSYE